MATKIDFTQQFAADPASVRAMLTDDAYARLRAERTGAISVDVSIEDQSDGGVTVTIARALPADVPSFAKSFVGETLKVDETYAWPASSDGTGSASFSAAFSAPITFRGHVTIEADGDGTVVRTHGEIKASVPLVGGKVEGFAKESMERYLRAEQKVGTEWLTSH